MSKKDKVVDKGKVIIIINYSFLVSDPPFMHIDIDTQKRNHTKLIMIIDMIMFIVIIMIRIIVMII